MKRIFIVEQIDELGNGVGDNYVVEAPNKEDAKLLVRNHLWNHGFTRDEADEIVQVMSVCERQVLRMNKR